MPLDKYQWIERREILSFEEIARLARIFISLGAEKIRLTGGEPLLRKGLERLVSLLLPMGVKDLCLTTNGFALPEKAAALAAAGLRRINVSLDSLDPEKFQRITRCDGLKRVLDGIFEARRCGMEPIKINTVIVRGVNDDEIVPLAEFARTNGFPIRFIEYMDVGNANSWESEKTVSKREILERIHAYSPIREIGRSEESSTSVDYEFSDGSGDIGVIASVTEPFCTGCTRARLTADGMLVTCLFSDRGEDLKILLRGDASDETILDKIQSLWQLRGDRYSEERLAAMTSPSGYRPEARRKIEMISLGG